jgi:hypothetical protein
MHLDDSSGKVDMSPAAVSRRIRKAFDMGMLNRHFLSKLVPPGGKATGDSNASDEATQSTGSADRTHARH